MVDGLYMQDLAPLKCEAFLVINFMYIKLYMYVTRYS